MMSDCDNSINNKELASCLFKKYLPDYRIIWWGQGVPAEIHPGRFSIDIDPVFIEKLEKEEVKSLMAHEIGHGKAFEMAMEKKLEPLEHSRHGDTLFDLNVMGIMNKEKIPYSALTSMREKAKQHYGWKE